MGIINQTDDTYGSVVAFKVDTVDGICPDGVNPPIFDNQNATGSLYISSGSYPKWVYYTIYTSGKEWSIAYTVNNSCSSSSPIYYERSEGTSLCVTGMIDNQDSTVGGYNYDNLVSYCNEASTTPISFSYQEDTLYFTDLIESWGPLLFQQARLNNTYVRIDGIRTSECQLTPKTDECMSVKGFTFVGPPPKNLDSYVWITDSSAQETLDDNCIVMVMNDTNPIRMDIRTCSGSGSPLPPKMIVCSTPAWGF
ncbi:hypothetical protein CAEBREN_17846 [Caenorhabditis brenneri]|uniref:Uncharacterized protein n=1 Tax=Caenorhabditis brenneri TaxID=135651 RepID=G0NU42_CAEBE|nr:hypothetical protein CAEBREN_17846 [Caenorhabditis brenneri]